MKRSTVVVVIMLAIILVFLASVNTDACTRMFWNTNGKAMVVGRNQDIYVNDQAIIYALPEGLNKNGGIEDSPLNGLLSTAALQSKSNIQVSTGLSKGSIQPALASTASIWVQPNTRSEMLGRESLWGKPFSFSSIMPPPFQKL